MAEISVISVKHDAIADFLIANPQKQLKEVAVHFGITQAWLSTVIHSTVFQNLLAEKKEGVFSATVVPLREKLLGIAHLGVDKLGEVMENASVTSDKQFIADTTDAILKNLGYSPKAPAGGEGGVGVQNNFYFTDKAALEAAREKMRVVHGTVVREEPVEVKKIE